MDFVEEDTTICGTPNYISPETISGKRFGPQSDLWAIGCILYVMLVGSPPFESSSVHQTLQRIKNGTFNTPSYLSRDASDLISRLLTYDPKKRITIDEVLTHPFLKSNNLEGSVLGKIEQNFNLGSEYLLPGCFTSQAPDASKF